VRDGNTSCSTDRQLQAPDCLRFTESHSNYQQHIKQQGVGRGNSRSCLAGARNGGPTTSLSCCSTAASGAAVVSRR